MEGYQNENRWINLSALPRCPYGNASRIKWSDCVGKSVPFEYDNVSGQIHIVEYDIQLSKYNRNVPLLKIYIDKYVPTSIEVPTSVLLKCNLADMVGNKIVDLAPHKIIEKNNNIEVVKEKEMI